MQFLGEIISFLREVYGEWQRDKTALLAASLAYYATFSLGPVLLIGIMVAGAIFGEDIARDQAYHDLQNMIGDQGAEFLRTLIEGTQNTDQNEWAAVLGIVTLLMGAAGVFKHLQDAMNIAWDVHTIQDSQSFWESIQDMVRQRLVSFFMVLMVGVLLMTSLAVSTGITALDELLGDNNVPQAQFILQLVNQFISFVVISGLFAVMYRTLPDVEIKWNDVGVGALFTAFMFTIGKYALGLYLGTSSFNSAYGAAGSFVLILAWIYYSAQILLFGAEFTQVYARRYGSLVEIHPIEEAT